MVINKNETLDTMENCESCAGEDFIATNYKGRSFVSSVGDFPFTSFSINESSLSDELFNKFNIRFMDEAKGYIRDDITFDDIMSIIENLGYVTGRVNVNSFSIFDFENGNLIELRIKSEESGIPWYRLDILSTSVKNIRNIIKYFEEKIGTKEYTGIVPVRMLFRQSDGRIANVEKREFIDDVIHDEAYPFVNNGNIDSYIDSYLKSDESVLVLIGPPGTGKTRLIRYLLYKSLENSNNNYRVKTALSDSIENNYAPVYYTNSESVLQTDELFSELLSDNQSYLVLEDIDFHLRDRSENNPLMYKLLSVADGLIKGGNNKIIISTNVDNERDIDDALTRVGRCFDIARFRKMSYNEANNMLTKLNGYESYMPERKEFSLSEVYRFYNMGTLSSQPEDRVIKRGRKPGF